MTGTWQTIDLAGKPADVFEPASTLGEKPRFGILYLHPVGQETLVNNPAFEQFFDQFRMACVCPHGGLSWWSDRICPDFDPHVGAERYLLEHVVPYFDTRWGLRPPGIGLTGISMGGQGALRLAFNTRAPFRSLPPSPRPSNITCSMAQVAPLT